MEICNSCFKDNSHALLKHANHNPAHWLGWKVALLREKWYSFKVLATLPGRWNEKKEASWNNCTNTVLSIWFEIQHEWKGKIQNYWKLLFTAQLRRKDEGTDLKSFIVDCHQIHTEKLFKRIVKFSKEN